MNWAVSKIEDITEIVTKGTTPTTYGMPFTDSGVNFIKAEALNGDSSLDNSGFTFVSESTHEKLKRSILVEGDILVTIAGAKIGQCGIVRAKHLPANTNQAVGIIRVLREKANPQYVYYFFKNPQTFQMCQGIGGQAAQPNINLTVLKGIDLPLPDLRTQDAIVEILSVYDDLIENNRHRIALLEETARLLYREWFIRFRFPGHEHAKIIGGIPEGWLRRYLGDVVTTQYGYTASASDEDVGPKFVRGTDINKRSFINWSTVPYCPEQSLDFNKYALVPGDILVIRMADPGKVALIEKPIRAVFASYLVRLKIKNPNELPPIFLFMTLMEGSYQGFISSSSGGSTRKSASARLLTDFFFEQPPKFLLELFVEQITPIREMITKLVEQSEGAAQARDLLLPRLMNGEIAL